MKTTILIVDDHTLVRETWALIFNRDERFEVVGECGSGEEAVQLAKLLLPNIIIMDINLPGISGIEATELIAKYHPQCKILGVSLHTQPTYAKKIMSAGARGYVTKNSTKEEMFEAVEAILRGEKFLCSEIKTILSERLLERDENPVSLNGLSARELEIISMIREGCSSKEIAERLSLAVKTVQVHRYNIFRKLRVKNRAELINLVCRSTSFV